MAEEFKITYATMSADNDQLHADFDAAVERVRQQVDHTFPLLINGTERTSDAVFPVYNPADTREPLAFFQEGDRQAARDAITAARAAFPAWRATPYEKRLVLVEKVADMITANRYDMAAIIRGNVQCDDLGIDTISAGNLIAFAMEAYERGIITSKDTGGMDLRFGNADAQLALIEMIAKKEGIGAILAEGISLRISSSTRCVPNPKGCRL